jgi:26S proteasome regulatory subunit N1
MLVERLKESDSSLYRPALESLRTLIKTSTSSMTSVPKPLKFLGPHYSTLIDCHAAWPESDTKVPNLTQRFLADILSVLSMSHAPESALDTLKYKLIGTSEPVGSWGHEYVRYLSSEIISQWNSFDYEATSTEYAKSVMALAYELVPFFMSHNAEADACDLLIELESLDKLPDLTDKVSYPRVCLYILGCAPYVTPPDDVHILKTAHQIYKKFEQYPSALHVALRLNDMELIKNDFLTCPDPYSFLTQFDQKAIGFYSRKTANLHTY